MRDGLGPIPTICHPADSHCVVSKSVSPLGYLTALWPSMRRPDAESADQDVLGTHLVYLHVGKDTPCSLGLSSPSTVPFALFSHDIPTP
ncbi:hypothetical protein M9458_035303, partial [Cirrhinus mrigala]